MTYTDDELLDARSRVCYLMTGSGMPSGSFTTTLINAIFIADNDNLDRLYLGFPALVDAVRLYQTGMKHNDLVDVLCHEDRKADDREHQAEEKRVVMVQHANGNQEIDPELESDK